MEWSSGEVEWSSGAVELNIRKVEWSSGVVELSSESSKGFESCESSDVDFRGQIFNHF